MGRVFDLLASLVGLFLLAPVFLVVAVAIKLESKGPIFFRGERAGKDGKPFGILKFRTMIAEAHKLGGGLTHHGDPRITRLGSFLRRTKIDELPQLINVIRGEMALVGPRPEDPRYLRYYSKDQRELLGVLPGITSIASIRYRNEEQLLPAGNWENVYIQSLLPAKLDIELNYLADRSFGTDLLVLLATIFALLKDEARFDAGARLITRIEAVLGRYVSWALIDVVLIVAAYLLALVIRSVNAGVAFPRAIFQAMLGMIVYIAVNYLFGIYNRIWRYATIQEAMALAGSVFTSTAALAAVGLLSSQRDLPLGAILLGGFFTFIFLAAARFRRSLFQGTLQVAEELVGFASGEGARVLIFGAKDIGQVLAWQLQNQLRLYQIVGFVDDDRRRHGMRIHNIPVLGSRHQIPELVARLHVDLILIAMPLSKARDPQELLRLCRQTSAQVKILPSLAELLEKNGHAPEYEALGEQDMLQRAPRPLDERMCRDLIAGRVIMVTGAAGSVGTELCRQIMEYRPLRLVLVDIDESRLHDLQVELQTKWKNLCIELALCDITNPSRLKQIFERNRPQIVFHAAAYKHVPILENYPHEGIRVNVLGTHIVHSLSQAYGAERFILISSDKAVNPTNVLGMTKWIGELMVTTPHTDGRTLSAAVRFGNVLRSRGSAVLTFEKQIELGGPVTITDPQMTRYFLTLDEAVSLVIRAAAMTNGGEVFLLDMGTPINILDLARRMIRQRGLRPGQDIEIEIVGQRPGEKISEELVAAAEEKLPTDHPSIFKLARLKPVNTMLFDQQLDRLAYVSQNGAGSDEARRELERCVAQLEGRAPEEPEAPTSRFSRATEATLYRR